MPLIRAGEQARELAAMLGERTAALPSAGTRRAPAGLNVTAGAGRWPGTQPAAWESSRPASQFPADPLPAGQISSILSAANARQQRDWPAAAHGDAGLVILLSALRVNELRPGMYAVWPPEFGAFTALADDACFPDLTRQYADAPALLHVCGDLDLACRSGGGSSYGALLVRAGALAQATWMTAVSAGLAGACYGRASVRVTEVAQLAGPGLRHLLSVAIGTVPVTVPDLPGQE
jgi:hypothetical protein